MGNKRCWDFMHCGAERDKSCLVVEQEAGRTCWLVAGTLCGGEVVCGHAKEIDSCKSCDFYKKVKSGEI